MARRHGVPTPIIRDITADTIVMEKVEGPLVRDQLFEENLYLAGRTVGRLHSAGLVHGDLTTSNMICREGRCFLIDFGLAQVSGELEARGVDLHVLFQTLESTTDNHPALKEAFLRGYREECACAEEVIVREQEIEWRGRYL